MFIGVTYECKYLSRLCQGMPKVNASVLKCFKIILQILKVWRCFFAYECVSIEK